jgi:hypothetical protein
MQCGIFRTIARDQTTCVSAPSAYASTMQAPGARPRRGEQARLHVLRVAHELRELLRRDVAVAVVVDLVKHDAHAPLPRLARGRRQPVAHLVRRHARCDKLHVVDLAVAVDVHRLHHLHAFSPPRTGERMDAAPQVAQLVRSSQ